MNQHTYYSTNQTPQRQNKFNGSIWGSLETATRNLLSSADTVYVVTGPAYRKVGGNESITYLTGVSGKNANPSRLPVPNYYWKALLKVKWSGSGTRKTVSSASAIGFWFVHQDYANNTPFANYAVSVNQIETWTGFDLFANLPDGIEATAEANTNWTTFQNF
jgi:endonuclease G